MRVRALAATLTLLLACAAPIAARAQAGPGLAGAGAPADSLARARADSLARAARIDSLARVILAEPDSVLRARADARADSGAGRADSTRRLIPATVRVPPGVRPGVDAPAPAPAPAEGGPETRILLMGGIAFPAAPPSLTRQTNPGGVLGAGMQFLLEPWMSVAFRGEWNILPFDQREFLRSVNLYGTGAQVEGGSTNIAIVSVAGQLHTRSPWPRFYADVGPGYAMVRHSDALIFDPVNAEVFLNEGETLFKGAMSTGAGVEFVRADGSGLFVELRWTAVFTGDGTLQLIPFRVGVVFP
jgi:hypothetical protein